jgi:hypothetical protein
MTNKCDLIEALGGSAVGSMMSEIFVLFSSPNIIVAVLAVVRNGCFLMSKFVGVLGLAPHWPMRMFPRAKYVVASSCVFTVSTPITMLVFKQLTETE